MSFQKLLTAVNFCLLATWTNGQSYDNETYGEGYGSEWLYYATDNGSTLVMNFSSVPEDARGMFFGDAYFYLYTRQNKDTPEELLIPENNSTLQSKYFNPSKNIKIVTHGWMSSDQSQWLQNIRDLYLKMYDYNVITVDWSELAHNPSYVWPALSTRYVGKRIAKLIKSLAQSYQIKGENVHLIGHSLGGQVMGYAGMFSEEPVSRITGLDPARPLFELPLMPPDFRLEKSDASFVDIIHTCGGVLGYKMSHGHADFYPNNGRARQPGCEGSQMMIEGCSHGRSCEFFSESIDPNIHFTAYPCESWKDFEDGKCKTNSTDMGDPVSMQSSGDYYLHTNSAPRYAKGDEQNQ